MKPILNECKCGKTYDINSVNATEKLCPHCNEKGITEAKRKEALHKAINRKGSKVSSNLERLAGIDE